MQLQAPLSPGLGFGGSREPGKASPMSSDDISAPVDVLGNCCQTYARPPEPPRRFRALAPCTAVGSPASSYSRTFRTLSCASFVRISTRTQRCPPDGIGTAPAAAESGIVAAGSKRPEQTVLKEREDLAFDSGGIQEDRSFRARTLLQSGHLAGGGVGSIYLIGTGWRGRLLRCQDTNPNTISAPYRA